MVRSLAGFSKNGPGAALSTISPASMNTILSATERAKPISWVTHDHRHALFGQVDHDVEDFRDHLRIQGRGRLVEQHDFRVHAKRPGDGDALLLAAGKLARVFLSLLGDTCTRSRKCIGRFLRRSGLGRLAHQHAAPASGSR